jgi:hypothetical protein
MALTRDTTAPITPSALTDNGAAKTGLTLPFVCKASEAYRIGDIVVMASGLADAVDAAQTDATILGVAVQAKTAGAAVASSDTVLIARYRLHRLHDRRRRYGRPHPERHDRHRAGILQSVGRHRSQP